MAVEARERCIAEGRFWERIVVAWGWGTTTIYKDQFPPHLATPPFSVGFVVELP